MNSPSTEFVPQPQARAAGAPARRIAWLINHTTLREFEVPLLRSLGYEVYTSKQLPFDNDFLSASVDLTDDRHVTLPPDALAILNAHNFYEHDFTPAVKQCLNTHFDTIICAAFTKLIDNLAHHFAGRIIVRVFGREHPYTYSEYFRAAGGPRLWNRIWEIQDRFWLAPSYRSIPGIEDELLKKRSVVLPLGLPERFFAHRDENTGADPRLLFVCPRIASHPAYYGRIYDDFRKNFGTLDYVIAGHQPVPVKDDPRVAGFVDDQAYLKWFREMRAMYYHSREPRHLHYHPLEAIAFGMPLVYMKGGLLDELGGKHQPGACATTREALRKLRRLLQGDRALAAEIKHAQPAILHEFSAAYCRNEWSRLFNETVMKTPVSPIRQHTPRAARRPRRIAIMLPVEYRGGTLRAAKDLAKILHTTAARRDEPLEVVFSCLAGHYHMEEHFADLKALGIPVRETLWSPVSRAALESALETNPHALKARLDHETYLQPSDGVRQFADCDFWLLISDRFTWPIVPAAQYAVLVFDYVQRYLPVDMFSADFWIYQKQGLFPTVRGADFAMCTTPSTGDDLNAYAGIPRGKIAQLPMFFECMSEAPAARRWNDNYFVWTTNLSKHKNHERVFRALARYYDELGGSLKLVILGTNTDALHPRSKNDSNPHAVALRKLLANYRSLRSNVTIAGELPNPQYLSALKYAAFLLHANLCDNGSFSVIDAAAVGTPTLASRYPAMEFMNDTFRLNLTFFDPYDVPGMAAALHAMETKCRNIALPDPAFFRGFDWRHHADGIYDTIVSRMNI